MKPSSRTPEGEPNRCPVCGAEIRMEPSQPARDAPCPHCGCLMWFGPARRTTWDPIAIEAPRRAIRDWVNHITDLSKTKIERLRYFQELVDGLVRCLAARGGVIWLPEEAKWRASYCTGLESVGITESVLCEPSHMRLVENVFASEAPAAIQPQGASPLAQEETNPTSSLVLLCPVKHAWETRAIVEVFQRADAPVGAQRGYLRFVEQICEIAGKSRVFCCPNRRPWWKWWG